MKSSATNIDAGTALILEHVGVSDSQRSICSTLLSLKNLSDLEIVAILRGSEPTLLLSCELSDYMSQSAFRQYLAQNLPDCSLKTSQHSSLLEDFERYHAYISPKQKHQQKGEELYLVELDVNLPQRLK